MEVVRHGPRLLKRWSVIGHWETSSAPSFARERPALELKYQKSLIFFEVRGVKGLAQTEGLDLTEAFLLPTNKQQDQARNKRHIPLRTCLQAHLCKLKESSVINSHEPWAKMEWPPEDHDDRGGHCHM